jgi:hypothetical protein
MDTARLTTAIALCVMWLALSLPATLASQSELVIVKQSDTAEQKLYHQPGCPLVRDGKDVVAMARTEAVSRGYKPHRECDSAAAPDPKAAGANPPAGGRGDARSTPAEHVFIDAAGQYYHRQGCAKIGKSPRRILLSEVSKRWPCPACRPPIRKRADAPLVPRWRG